MKKNLFLSATMAAMLASCSSDDLSVLTSYQQEAASESQAVGFEAYTQRSQTRAGSAGVMENDKLKTEGFGVFAYYTDLNEYDQSIAPNFMYNQHVYNNGTWTYSPIKYWPNEYGSNAQSGDVDKLSFFAYAPHVLNNPSTGKVVDDKEGITGFTRSTATGDPYVKYIGSLDPTKCVDLCWGVVDPSANQDWNINGGKQTMAKGLPWLNVQRPEKSLGQKLKFSFMHALSQLNVKIDADVNTNIHGAGAEVDSETKVFVRSVTFTGFAMKGALNLNNEEAGVPNWKGYNCNNEPLQSEEYTIYDGMKDGKEGTGYTASNEKVTGLNPSLIQHTVWARAAEGVTKAEKNLFNGAPDAPIYVIPTGDALTVTIVYDIETRDQRLAGTVSDLETAGVSVENKITKSITVSNNALKLEAGKKYTINLHLGMSQVEFDADVVAWDDTTPAGEAWVPGNGPGDVYPTALTISGAEAITGASGYAGRLTVTVLPDNVSDKGVTWTSSNPSLLAVDGDGKVSLAGAIPLAGEDVKITATSNVDGSVKDTKTIRVAPALGMIVASNAKVYLDQTAATDDHATPSAYIAYLSANAGQSLAIGLGNDAPGGTSWNVFATSPGWGSTPDRDAISGGTWRWPTKTDFDNILPQMKTLHFVGSGIISEGFYWSLTEFPDNQTERAMGLYFKGDESRVYDRSKTNDMPNYYVRAVLAF